jgi:hypothetical protein
MNDIQIGEFNIQRYEDVQVSWPAITRLAGYIIESQQEDPKRPDFYDGYYYRAMDAHENFILTKDLQETEVKRHNIGLFVTATRLALIGIQRMAGNHSTSIIAQPLKVPKLFDKLTDELKLELKDFYDWKNLPEQVESSSEQE